MNSYIRKNVELLSFEEAIKALKLGALVSRLDWLDDYLQIGAYGIGKYSEDSQFQYWTPSQDEMLVNDWYVVEIAVPEPKYKNDQIILIRGNTKDTFILMLGNKDYPIQLIDGGFQIDGSLKLKTIHFKETIKLD